MSFNSGQMVDGMRPLRRRSPRAQPHRRTLYHIKKKNWHISPRFLSIFLGVFFFVLLVSIYAVLFWSNLFKVKEPVILGAGRVPQQAIETTVASLIDGTRWGLIPRNALLGVSSGEIAHAVEQVSPAIKEVEVRKELPNVLKINITEREPLAIWSAAGRFFFIDERGIAYDEIVRSESRDVSLPVIVDERHRETVQNDRVITEQALGFVRETYEGLTRLAGVGVNFYIAPSRLAPDLILVTSEGWKVLFDATQPASTQVTTLSEVLKEQVKDRKNLEYIDLRVSGRVFVK
jgi:cell division septal protein FtsQ